MKSYKRCLLIIVLAFMAFTVSAYGLDPLSLNLENYFCDEGVMEVYFNTNYDQELLPDQLSLSIGNDKPEISDLKRIKNAETGVTYLFLVDVSGSMTNKKIESVKEILEDTLEESSSKDNVSIYNVGNDAYDNPFVSGKTEYQRQIDAIARISHEDTNLYSSVVKGLEVLKTKIGLNQKKCMVILSDGEDDYTTGITKDEVYKAIEASNIPVFTVAMMSENPSQRKIDASKILGSFARSSSGGLDLVHGLDETTSSGISSKINNALENGYVLTADLSNYASEGKEQVLKLELKTETGSTFDSYTIETSGITPPVTPTPVPTLTPEALTDEQEDADHKRGTEEIAWYVPFICGVIVIVVIAAIIVLLKKSKKKAEYKALAILQPEQGPEGEEHNNKEAGYETAQLTDMIDAASDSQPGYQEPDVTIVLTKMDRMNNQVYMADIFGAMVIGRVQAKSDLAFPEDSKLSAAHCQISFSANKLFLKDLNSTNGTYVNGVPISSQYKLEKGDVLQIGSIQFRINW